MKTATELGKEIEAGLGGVKTFCKNFVVQKHDSSRLVMCVFCFVCVVLCTLSFLFGTFSRDFLWKITNC